MGLFSSSHRYEAHAASSALLPEEDRIDTVKSTMLEGIFTGLTSVAESVVIALGINMNARAKSIRRYAQKEYVFGFPENDAAFFSVPRPAVEAAISRYVGEDVSLTNMANGSIDEAFFIDWHLQTYYQDPNYFTWSNGPPDNPVWDENTDPIEIPVPHPHSSQGPYYTATNQPGYVRIEGTNEYQARYAYFDIDQNFLFYEVESTFDFSPWIEHELIQGRYETLAEPGVTKYFIYEVGSDEDPELEAAIVRHEFDFNFLPIIVLMRDRVWFDEMSDEDLDFEEGEIVKTTKKICKRLSIDPFEVKEEYIDMVETSIEDETRPGTDKLDDWDFFIQFSAPIRSQIRGTQEYLYHFWQSLIPSSPSFDDYQDTLPTGLNQPEFGFEILEGGEDGFNANYKFSYIHAEYKVGQYIPEGWEEPLVPRRMFSKVYEYGTEGYAQGIYEVHGEGTPIAGPDTHGYHDYGVWTRQHYDAELDEYYYYQVLVMAPSMEYVVNTSDEAGNKRYRTAVVELFPDPPEDPEEEVEESEWKIPIQIAALKETSAMHREECLQDSLCATVFLVEHQKVKWYQKTFFKWLIIIIVVILVVLTWHYELLPAIWAAAGTAFAAGATAVGVGYLLLYVALSFALGFLISFAGGLIGGTWGKVFVIVASIMVAGQNPFTNVTSKWTTFATSASWGSAASFLGSLKPFLQIGMVIYEDVTMRKYKSDMRDFTLTAKEKYEELRDAEARLGDQPSWLDPMSLVSAIQTGYVEQPENYYQRTLHDNPGQMGIELVDNFTEIAMFLPNDGNEGNVVDEMFETFKRQTGQA